MNTGMGNNYGLPNFMFNYFEHGSTNQEDFSDDSSSTSESEDDGFDSNRTHLNNHRSARPAYRSDTTKFSSYSNLTLDKVKRIEIDLDFNEFISLIFLLYDSKSGLALQVIRTTIEAGPEHFSRDILSNWARSQPKNWEGMLVEALAVIQNYGILQKLGYSKTDIDEHFFPRLDTTLYLDRVKKMLYLVCECLASVKDRRILIELVRLNGQFEDDITLKCDSAYMEFHILFWSSRKYVNIDGDINLQNLTKHMIVIDSLRNKVLEINSMEKSIKKERERIRASNFVSENEEVYKIIDPKNVGLCIIINNTEFTKKIDKRKRFKKLLPKDPLKDRAGSLVDVRQLTNTFTQLMFKVVEEHDIPHDRLVQEIQILVQQNFEVNVHSVLFLCILSHGAEGIVYGVNSIPVTIQEIQNSVSGDTPVKSILADIPKVIIIQACQGTKALVVEADRKLTEVVGMEAERPLTVDAGQLTLDGPDKIYPKFGDVLTCMAIIPGYVAVRSITEGTKYIQTLCECLMQHYRNEHFIDIVTIVQRKLNMQPMHIRNVLKELSCCSEHDNCLNVYMTPMKSDSFRKKLYLIRK